MKSILEIKRVVVYITFIFFLLCFLCSREHLGIQQGDASIDVSDPVCMQFYKNVWLRQASINTSMYDKVGLTTSLSYSGRIPPPPIFHSILCWKNIRPALFSLYVALKEHLLSLSDIHLNFNIHPTSPIISRRWVEYILSCTLPPTSPVISWS